MLRKLLENDEFRQDFIALYADWLNSRFLPSNLLAAVDEHRNLIVNEMPRHLARWDRTLFAWEGSIDNVREYILERPDFAREHIMDEFELPDTLQLALDIQPAGAGLDSTGAQKEFKQRDKYSIPYGCFLPKGIDGLFLAGRNISGTHMAHSNFRVMPICVNMGQGVGTAAALCARKDLLPRELDIAEVQEALKAQGVEP